MNKNFLSKLIITSFLVGGVNFIPAVAKFDAGNLQIVSVAYASVKNVSASGRAIFNFGENEAQIVNTVKNVARMRAIQAAKEKAGIYVKSSSTTVDGILTVDDIYAYTSNNITILNVQYKKIPVQAHDVKGNNTGEIAFMYEAIVTASINTDSLAGYIQRDYKEKSTLIRQSKASQENIAKINQDFDSLRNSTNDVKQIKSRFNQINNEILAQQKLEEGVKFIYRKDYESAILKLDEAIKLNSNSAELYFCRGIAYYKLDSYLKTIQDSTKAIELNPNYADAYILRGGVHLETEGYKQAISDLNQAIKMDSNSADAYTLRGSAYLFLEKFSQAISDLTQAIKLNPTDINSYGLRGSAYAMVQNYDKAILDFTKVIQLGANNGKTYYLRGLCYKELGNNAQARKDFAKARELGYDN